MNWFEKLFSADELRVSALVLCLLVCLCCVLIYLFLNGSIPTQMVQLTETLIYSVAGVNIAASVSASVFGKNSSSSEQNEPEEIAEVTSEIVKDSDIPPSDSEKPVI